MNYAARRAKVLRLSSLEKMLFEKLSLEPQSISRLAITLKKPRTSLYYPLRSLKERGLIETARVGKRIRWRRAAENPLIFSPSILFSETSGTKVSTSHHSEFFLRQGKSELVGIYQNLSHARNIRAMVIQPNQSIKSILKVFSQNELIKINTRIKKNSIILETILQENVIPFYIELLKIKKWPASKVFAAFRERMADTTYIPKEFFNFDAEIIIMPRVAYLIHWGNFTAVEIRNQEMIGLLRDLFTFTKHFGRKINQNELIKMAQT